MTIDNISFLYFSCISFGANENTDNNRKRFVSSKSCLYAVSNDVKRFDVSDEVVNNSEFVESMASTETPRESAECNLHF